MRAGAPVTSGKDRPGSGPLEGVRVVEFGQYGAAPVCGMLLGDFGADVIKIEPPDGDPYRRHSPIVDGESYYFMTINRNKRGVTLDLKSPRAFEVVRRLVVGADIVLENFRPGVMARLGLGYEALRAIQPGLIYCSISGYGQTGPLRDEGSYDIIIQGYTGMMNATGEGDGPPVKLIPAVPDVVGALTAAFAILASLRARERSGTGQHIDVSLFDASLYGLALVYLGQYFGAGTSPGRMGSAHPSIVPMQAFQTRDGEYLTTGVPTESMWPPLCRILGLPELAADPRFATNQARVAHRAALLPILEERIKTRARTEWLQAFREAGVPCGPVNTVAEAIEHPQAKSREMQCEFPHQKLGRTRMVGIPAKLSATPGTVRRSAPMLGEHNAEVLGALGYRPEEIDGLTQIGPK